MQILICYPALNKSILKTVQTLPPIGARVDMFHTPRPKIHEIVMWPERETVQNLAGSALMPNVDAIIFVE